MRPKGGGTGRCASFGSQAATRATTTRAAAPATRNAARQPATALSAVSRGTPTMGAHETAPIVHPIARRAAGPRYQVPAIASDNPGTVASLRAPAILARNRMGKIGANPKMSRHAAADAKTWPHDAPCPKIIRGRAGDEAQRRAQDQHGRGHLAKDRHAHPKLARDIRQERRGRPEGEHGDERPEALARAAPCDRA